MQTVPALSRAVQTLRLEAGTVADQKMSIGHRPDTHTTHTPFQPSLSVPPGAGAIFRRAVSLCAHSATAARIFKPELQEDLLTRRSALGLGIIPALTARAEHQSPFSSRSVS